MKKKILIALAAFVVILQFILLTCFAVFGMKARLHGINLQTFRFITPLSFIKFFNILIPYGLTAVVDVLLCKLLKAGKHKALKAILSVIICCVNIAVCCVFLWFAGFEKTQLYSEDYKYYPIIAQSTIEDECAQIMPARFPEDSTDKKLLYHCFYNNLSSEPQNELVILSYSLDKDRYLSEKQMFSEKYTANKDSVTRFGSDSFSFNLPEINLIPYVYTAFFDDEQRVVYAYKLGSGSLDEKVNEFLSGNNKVE